MSYKSELYLILKCCKYVNDSINNHSNECCIKRTTFNQ